MVVAMAATSAEAATGRDWVAAAREAAVAAVALALEVGVAEAAAVDLAVAVDRSSRTL